jgi:hypothetical protein
MNFRMILQHFHSSVQIFMFSCCIYGLLILCLFATKKFQTLQNFSRYLTKKFKIYANFFTLLTFFCKFPNILNFTNLKTSQIPIFATLFISPKYTLNSLIPNLLALPQNIPILFVNNQLPSNYAPASFSLAWYFGQKTTRNLIRESSASASQNSLPFISETFLLFSFAFGRKGWGASSKHKQRERNGRKDAKETSVQS